MCKSMENLSKPCPRDVIIITIIIAVVGLPEAHAQICAALRFYKVQDTTASAGGLTQSTTVDDMSLCMTFCRNADIADAFVYDADSDDCQCFGAPLRVARGPTTPHGSGVYIEGE